MLPHACHLEVSSCVIVESVRASNTEYTVFPLPIYNLAFFFFFFPLVWLAGALQANISLMYICMYVCTDIHYTTLLYTLSLSSWAEKDEETSLPHT